MKLIITAMAFVCLALFGCSSNTPQDYFSKAVLNCNLLYGFAGYELKRDLANPSEKLVDEKTMKMAPVTRKELVEEKLARVEENYQKVRSLGNDAGAADMVKASLALYEFVIPVYKNEYNQLAALYDNGSPAQKIEALERSINEKYEVGFLQLYNAVGVAGKAYAAKHGIQVMDVDPAPPKITNP
jgi:hypothetical protein